MKDPAIVASMLGADHARLGQEVAEARRLIERSGLATLVEVDGGISATTAPGAVRAGAQLLVAGSAILAHPEGRSAAVAELRRSLQPDLQAAPDGRAELESGTHATGGIHGNPRDG
jgi:pentose-5-phosphate-3-epimerase